MRLAVSQHLHALDRGGDEIFYHNCDDPPPAWLRWSNPDAVVLHTIFLGMRWHVHAVDFERQYRWLAGLDCPKVALPQDEYDHSEVLEDWLEGFGVTDVFSCFGPDQRAVLYTHVPKHVRFHKTLTGFIDVATAEDIAKCIVPLADRPNDIVYRAAQLPYWFGSHGQLKHELGSVVRERAVRLALSCDISTRHEDTVISGWLDFLMSGRAVIGCESGSSVLDPRGRIQERIRALLAENPELTFAEVDAGMPSGWDSYAFFAISPRHLEAIVTKTCQILVEGSYSGVLEPGRHYIPVRRDLSNLDDALERLRDLDEIEEIVERAYTEIYLSSRHTIDAFADTLRAAIGTPERKRLRVPVPILRAVGDVVDAAAATPPAAGRRGRALLGRLRRRVRVLTADVRVPVPRPVARTLLRFRRRLSTWGQRIRLAIIFVRTGLTAAGATANPHVRRVLVEGMPPAGRPSPRALVRDLLRLAILARIRRVQGSAAVPWWVSLSRCGDTIVLRTEARHYDPRRTTLDDEGGSVRKVVWDHSVLGIHAPLLPSRPNRGSVVVGPSGIHEFAALSLLAGRVSAHVVAALQWPGREDHRSER